MLHEGFHSLTSLDLRRNCQDDATMSYFPCEHCDKNFTDTSNLQRHIRLNHLGARAHACTDCGKTFATSSGLKQHQHIHSTVKPFQCEVCLKAYTQFSNLCRHKRMHADCRQQIKCKDCGQAFSTTHSLSKHKRFCEGLLRRGVGLGLPMTTDRPLAMGAVSPQLSMAAAYMNLYGHRPPFSFYSAIGSKLPSPANQIMTSSPRDGGKLPSPFGNSFPFSQHLNGIGKTGFVSNALDSSFTERSESTEIEAFSDVSSCSESDGPLSENENTGSLNEKSNYLSNDDLRQVHSSFYTKGYLLAMNSRMNMSHVNNCNVQRKFESSQEISPRYASEHRNGRELNSSHVIEKTSSNKTKDSTNCIFRPFDVPNEKTEQPLDLSVKTKEANSGPLSRKTHIFGHDAKERQSLPPARLSPYQRETFPKATTFHAQSLQSKAELEKTASIPSLPDTSPFVGFTPRFPLPNNALAAAAAVSAMPNWPFFAYPNMFDPLKSMYNPLVKFDRPSPPFSYGMGQNKLKDRYSCKYCGKIFPRSANLTRHLRTHTGEQPYKCKYCERSFSISSNLQRHVRNIHNKEKPFKCSLCDRCFGQQTNLDRHVKKHETEGPNITDSPLHEADRCDDLDVTHLVEKDESFFEMSSFLSDDAEALESSLVKEAVVDELEPETVDTLEHDVISSFEDESNKMDVDYTKSFANNDVCFGEDNATVHINVMQNGGDKEASFANVYRTSPVEGNAMSRVFSLQSSEGLTPLEVSS